jgi:hypothetical protein
LRICLRSNCNKISNFGKFSKFCVGGETRLDALHFISWAQIQKIPFLWI